MAPDDRAPDPYRHQRVALPGGDGTWDGIFYPPRRRRHRPAGTLRLLNGLGAAWVQIDEPKFRLSIAQNRLPNVESFYYMRLHGRNARKWWRHDRAEERYDYHYSAAELQPFRDTADAAARLVKRLYLYMNNHFAAKAVANAATLKHQLGLEAGGAWRAEMVTRYPELEGVVRTEPEAAAPLLPVGKPPAGG